VYGTQTLRNRKKKLDKCAKVWYNAVVGEWTAELNPKSVPARLTIASTLSVIMSARIMLNGMLAPTTIVLFQQFAPFALPVLVKHHAPNIDNRRNPTREQFNLICVSRIAAVKRFKRNLMIPERNEFVALTRLNRQRFAVERHHVNIVNAERYNSE
jgi:hypothetical protein